MLGAPIPEPIVKMKNGIANSHPERGRLIILATKTIVKDVMNKQIGSIILFLNLTPFLNMSLEIIPPSIKAIDIGIKNKLNFPVAK